MAPKGLTPEEHKRRHVELHHALDELVADYLWHNPNATIRFTTVWDLAKWSCEQTKNPTSEDSA